MTNLKTSRPFQERFLDGFDRAQLREEVQKVKPRRLSGMRRKYAGWVLGASLALGGVGIPLKVSKMLHAADSQKPPAPVSPPDTAAQIASDLTTAKQIADQVAGGISGGVAGAVQDVEKTVASAPAQVVQAPQAIVAVADQVRQRFFN